jgi:hypothetical protein
MTNRCSFADILFIIWLRHSWIFAISAEQSALLHQQGNKQGKDFRNAIRIQIKEKNTAHKW